jgi:predicted short-subunit dehydrogenase-like oxidoreductase (DUF2520 family)
VSNIVIVGPGRVGTALARSFQAAGHRLTAAYSRDPASSSAQRFTELTGVAVQPITAVAVESAGRRDDHPLVQAHLVLVTVPDEAIAPVARTLAEQAPLRPGLIVAHTAGALDASALAPVKARGAAVVSMHPLQTIADPARAPAILQDVTYTLDGDAGALAQVVGWIQHIGGRPVTIDPADRPRYHAAAVLASNALIALAAVAADLARLPDGLAPLLPLLEGAVANLKAKGLPDALTGPIERGDAATVRAHLSALADHPAALSVYTALGRVTADLALQKGSLSKTEAASFVNLFGGNCDD